MTASRAPAADGSPLAPIFDAIPAELAEYRQHVAWRPKSKGNGKYDKVPVNPNSARGENAAVDDSDTWGSFAAAQAMIGQHKTAGVGFVLTMDDPIVAVDLDDCITDDGTMSAEAMAIVRALNSYTERSPYRRGLRILVRGKLPPFGRRNDQRHIEVYEHGRFVTLTGHQLPNTPATIEPRQGALLAFHRSVFGEQSPAANGATHATAARAADDPQRDHSTQALIAANWPHKPTDGSRGPSRHDDYLMPLAGFLTGHTSPEHVEELLLAATEAAGDADFMGNRQWRSEIHRLVNDSATKRQNDARFRGLPKLGEQFKSLADALAALWPSPTLEDLISAVPACSEAPDAETPSLRFTLHTPDAIKQREPPDALMDDILMRNSVAQLVAAHGSFKSFLGLDWAGSIGGGYEWHGHAVHQGPVVYIAAEAPRSLGQRIRAWEIARGHPLTGVYFITEAPQLTKPADVVDLIVSLSTLPVAPVAIFVDTVARTAVGVEENSAKEMGIYIAAADSLRRRYGCTVVLVHHMGWSGRSRGSSSLPAALDAEIELRREGDTVTVTCTKQRDGEEFEPITLVKRVVELEPSGDFVPTSIVLDLAEGGRRQTAGQQRVVSVLSGLGRSVTDAEWRDACKKATPSIPRRSYYRAKKDALAAKLVVKDKSERFTVAPQLTPQTGAKTGGTSPSMSPPETARVGGAGATRRAADALAENGVSIEESPRAGARCQQVPNECHDTGSVPGAKVPGLYRPGTNGTTTDTDHGTPPRMTVESLAGEFSESPLLKPCPAAGCTKQIPRQWAACTAHDAAYRAQKGAQHGN